jgi:hypothetical protein
MTFDPQTARRIVLKRLSSAKAGDEIRLDSLESDVGFTYGHECGRTTPGHGGDWRQCLGPNGASIVHQVVWDLIVQRVLTIENVAHNYSWATVRVTEFGTKVLAEQRWSPHDPDGYIKELRKQAPTLASLCQMYAEEALQCFRSGCYLATVVMLGAASEGIANELFRRFVAALKAGGIPEAPSVERKMEKEQSIYRKYEVFRKHFDPLVKPKLPSELGDDLNLQFDGVFSLIRFYRNDAGHPTGTRIERVSAFTSLVLFVPYCRRVEDLINWLDANSGSLNT